ncbi:MAG: C40 family peptidase [Longimicrobiales bacterium]
MPRTPLPALIPALVCALLVPEAVQAQRPYAFSPYVARDGALPEAPLIAGVAGTHFTGMFGARVGGGVELGRVTGNADAAADPRSGSAWAVDADLLIAPLRLSLLRGSLGTLEPYAFVGLGIHGAHTDLGAEVVPVWSYGVAASKRLASWLTLDAEARYRMPHESDPLALPAGFQGGWEQRIGLSVQVGSARRPQPVLARRTSTRLPPRFERRDEPLATPLVARTLIDAEAYLGTPYVWGGSSPATGFDCSGFVQFVYERNGVALPRTSRQMAYAGEPVGPDVYALVPGDLLLFAGNGATIDHVAIYAGEGRIIHSSRSGGGVRYDDLYSQRGRWFAEHLVAARRVAAGGAKLAGDGTLLGIPAFDRYDTGDEAPIRN